MAGRLGLRDRSDPDEDLGISRGYNRTDTGASRVMYK